MTLIDLYKLMPDGTNVIIYDAFGEVLFEGCISSIPLRMIDMIVQNMKSTGLDHMDITVF